MKFLEKIQKLPLSARKMILVAVIVAVGAVLVSLWLGAFGKKMEAFKKEGFTKELNLPSLREELEKEKKSLEESFPQPEVPEGFQVPEEFNLPENPQE